MEGERLSPQPQGKRKYPQEVHYLFGDFLDNKRVAVIDLAATEIFCVLVALVPVMLWLAEDSSDVGIVNSINLSPSFSSEGGLVLLPYFQLLNQPILRMSPPR